MATKRKKKRRQRAKTVTTPDPRSLLAHLRVSGLLFVLLLLPSFSFQENLLAAQRPNEPYALIAGTVWGPDDQPVYGVPVKIRPAKDKKPKWEVYSDHHGEFAQRVPPGEADYILTADLKHLKSADGQPLHLVQEVTVHVYNDEREDTGLHLTH
jgi:hypothetical protein